MTEGDEKAKAKQLLGGFVGVSKETLFLRRDEAIRIVNQLAAQAKPQQRPRLRQHESRLIQAGGEGRPGKFDRAFQVMLAELGLRRRPTKADQIAADAIDAVIELTEAADFAPSPSPP